MASRGVKRAACAHGSTYLCYIQKSVAALTSWMEREGMSIRRMIGHWRPYIRIPSVSCWCSSRVHLPMRRPEQGGGPNQCAPTRLHRMLGAGRLRGERMQSSRPCIPGQSSGWIQSIVPTEPSERT